MPVRSVNLHRRRIQGSLILKLGVPTMWNWIGGRTFFHALTKYRTIQAELRGMTPEEFDSLRVYLLMRDERTPHDVGLTLGQFRAGRRDDEALEAIDPRSGRRHAVLDVDKQLKEGIIVLTVDTEPSPE